MSSDRAAGDFAPIPLSVLVCAHNEELNLGVLLESALGQAGPSFELKEVVVVASGCTDRTAELLRAAHERDPRVRPIVQETRGGKVAALTLAHATAAFELLLFENADTRPAPGAYEAVASRFLDPSVELVATHPVPTNREKGFTVRMGRVMWEIHDAVSRISPKVGEAYAIRRAAFVPPVDLEDDDTFLSAERALSGGRAYADDAVILNRVPTSLGDLFLQRRRIGRLVLGLRRRSGLTSVTWDPPVFLRAIGNYIRRRPLRWPELVGLAALEVAARVSAIFSVLTTPSAVVLLRPIESTKRPIDPPIL